MTREKVLLSLWFKRQKKSPPTVKRIIIDLNDANDEFIVLLLIVRCQKLRQLFLHELFMPLRFFNSILKYANFDFVDEQINLLHE